MPESYDQIRYTGFADKIGGEDARCQGIYSALFPNLIQGMSKGFVMSKTTLCRRCRVIKCPGPWKINERAWREEVVEIQSSLAHQLYKVVTLPEHESNANKPVTMCRAEFFCSSIPTVHGHGRKYRHSVKETSHSGPSTTLRAEISSPVANHRYLSFSF